MTEHTKPITDAEAQRLREACERVFEIEKTPPYPPGTLQAATWCNQVMRLLDEREKLLGFAKYLRDHGAYCDEISKPEDLGEHSCGTCVPCRCHTYLKAVRGKR